MASNKAKLVTLSAFIAAVVASGVSAADHNFEVTGTVGRIFIEDPLEDANTWGLGVGMPVTDNWTLEAVYSKYDSETQVGGLDLDGTQYRLDGIYNIDTTSQWKPFLAIGVGDLKRQLNVASPVSSRETLLNLGVGLKRSLGSDWEFRSDIRAFNSLDNEYTDLTLNLGLTYLFGAKTAKPAKVAAPVVAAVAPVAAAPVDTDGDGVVDAQDKCANTPAAHKVDASGCSLKLTETVSIKLNITFDSGKSVVKPEFANEVAGLAKFMNEYEGTVVTIEGHTDSQGAESLNQKLSQSRADAVKAALISQYDISADRVTAVGYGESKPIADNATAQGREQNRRVVAQVSTDVTKTEMRNQ